MKKTKALPSTPKRSEKSSKSARQNTTNQVRIIGGQFKRRNISFIDADGLRPTPDRLRETIFNWLMGDLQDAKVLDVCAGSGVLGFESLSRGASFAVMIEANQAQASELKRNADVLKLSKSDIHIIHATAQSALPTLDASFDVIFIDPPYALNLWHEILTLIIKHRLTHADTLIYIESDQALDRLIESFSLDIIKSAKVGQVFAGIFKPPHQPL
ncbi:16S rRNA (guanine(966)-N(2))-methyltransferase RsmD [Moraxella nasibovis]|uniref:16S rRNA (guanine(966)-N(2))-methyltransferase RsmD n=1 Tax=Moraxella nasibovis TaxID=2904120 RepID=UPI0024105CF3|nr:16S rRNA (guanine(966)-N(2))-methyltransferase RsmD [Moraxella nasibovis]WFF37910.1 16S rRNA (guanine(966)-N(2))-methyltransferase RsmD [Moraxella nasibovis]